MQCQFNVYVNNLSTPITVQDTAYKLILILLFCPLVSSLQVCECLFIVHHFIILPVLFGYCTSKFWNVSHDLSSVEWVTFLNNRKAASCCTPSKTVTFCYVYMDVAQCIKKKWAFSISKHVYWPVRLKRGGLGSLGPQKVVNLWKSCILCFVGWSHNYSLLSSLQDGTRQHMTGKVKKKPENVVSIQYTSHDHGT